MEFWERALIAAGVVVAALVVAKLIDRQIGRGLRSSESITRYRVLRRGLASIIITVGVFSGLLIIPQVRVIAGGLLASSAILGLIIGFASQRTLGNFVAGIMIALSQPLRIGDSVEVGGVEGEVEEIGLIYTFIRTRENDRLVIPNEKLASDTIRNSTIRNREMLAQVTVQVPPDADLEAALGVLRDEGGAGAEVFVASLEGPPSLVLRAWAADARAAEALEQELRLRIQSRLRREGVLS